MPESKVFMYQTELSWMGGRRGTVAAGDRPTLTIAPPEDFPGGGPIHRNPEHLFLASLSSCTMLSFLAHCAHNGVEVVSYRAEATGQLARREEDRRYAFNRVTMVVTAVVAGGHSGLARTLTGKPSATASSRRRPTPSWRPPGGSSSSAACPVGLRVTTGPGGLR